MSTRYEQRRGDVGQLFRNKRPPGTVEQLLIDFYGVKRAYNLHGKKLEKKSGKALKDGRNATVRKVAEMLFSELLKLFGN